MTAKHYVGLDVSARSVNLCVVDDEGRVAHERKLNVDPGAISAHLLDLDLHLVRIGLEAGMLSQHLFAGLAAAGLPVVCVETRHMKAALSAQLNKTDRHDARGIAQMMRVGLFKPVHVKTPTSQRLRTILTARQLLRNKLQDVENEIRGLIRNFGYHSAKSPHATSNRESVSCSTRATYMSSPIRCSTRVARFARSSVDWTICWSGSHAKIRSHAAL